MSDIYKTETILQAGVEYIVEWVYDTMADAPWDNSDYHGPVSNWTNHNKKPGEWVLAAEHRGYRRFYDAQAAMKLARTQWGFTNGRDAAEAVERDFDYLRRWCADQWHYCGIIVTRVCDCCGGKSLFSDSLWGIEDDGINSAGYHATAIQDLIGNIEYQMNNRKAEA
jgi:hypothetical protein